MLIGVLMGMAAMMLLVCQYGGAGPALSREHASRRKGIEKCIESILREEARREVLEQLEIGSVRDLRFRDFAELAVIERELDRVEKSGKYQIASQIDEQLKHLRRSFSSY